MKSIYRHTNSEMQTYVSISDDVESKTEIMNGRLKDE